MLSKKFNRDTVTDISMGVDCKMFVHAYFKNIGENF